MRRPFNYRSASDNNSYPTWMPWSGRCLRQRRNKSVTVQRELAKHMRFHEYLKTAKKEDGQTVVRCINCDYEFCKATENYKEHALVWERTLDDIPLRKPLSGDPMFTHYQEFICPGCGTLLQVDVFCPELDNDVPILWDTELKP